MTDSEKQRLEEIRHRNHRDGDATEDVFWLLSLLSAQEEKIRVAREALDLADRFWYSDHPNDTVEGYEARETIRKAHSQLS